MANITLPAFFSDGMVLQQLKPIHIWGHAKANESVTVSLAGQKQTTKADRNGEWKLQLAPLKAGGPYAIDIKGENSITIRDVLIGEVWICSGQSNMEFLLNKADHAQEEIANANYPDIHYISLQRETSMVPLKDISPASWKACTPATAGDASAVAYFFARKLRQELHVPVGLIITSWGGTNVEAWTSAAALQTNADFKPIVARQLQGGAAQVMKSYRDRMINTVSQFQHGDMTNDTQNWKNADYNDASWTSITARKNWEAQGLTNINGIAWYRKEITLTGEQAGKSASLELVPVDDMDETYVNGTLIGKMAGYNTPRKYTIPAGILQAGKNVIAIRVSDTGGEGGLVGDDGNLQITVEGSTPLSLNGAWKLRVDTSGLMYNVGPNENPSSLYNAMIHPLIPYTIRGAIWYQGESNADRAYQYASLFPLMIRNWRSDWKQGDFPFYFVQLATFDANKQNGLTGSKWAELRDAQTKTLSLPNTGMAVTIDVGNPADIHPTNKQEVGLRLALNALNKTYGQQITPCGPLYQSMQVQGNKIILTFSETGKGLIAKANSGELKTFAIAGADHQFKWAKAYIENNKVIVSSDEVSGPVAVRYAWIDNAEQANLYNEDGLPASPFRTDNWEELTKGNKYIY